MAIRRSVSTCVRSVAALLLVVAPSAARAATLYVPAGADLQTAINEARPGDTILLEPGATFTGTFYLPSHGGTSYVTIRSAAANEVLPRSSARMTPAYAPHLPKIKSSTTTAALRTLPGAAYWRLMFVEFLANEKGLGDVITLGSSVATSLTEVPHHLILDRIYIHGDPLHGQKRGVALNSADTVIVNSHIDGIRSAGQDTQAIGGWNGPGPYRIENNYLEAAGEVVMFGGSDPSIAWLTPSDITLRYNTLTRPLSWRDPIVATPAGVRSSASAGGALPAGTYGYRVVARRMAGAEVARSLPSQEVRVTVAAGSRVSLQWDPVPDAAEYLVYGRTPAGQDRYWKVTAPSFDDNGDAGTPGAPSSKATMWQVKNLLELKHARRVTVSYNVMTNNWSQAQNGVAILVSPRNQNGRCTWCVVEDVTLEYNLIRHAGGGLKISGYDDTYQSLQTNDIVVRHNEFSDIAKAWGGNGYIVTLLTGARDVTFDHNTMISPDLSLLTVDNAPMENFRFTNNLARHNTYGIKGSGQGVGSTTIQYYFPGSTIDRNVLAGGKASYYPAGNLFPSVADFQAHFTDYAGFDFSLVPGTDWEAAATDHLDLGANDPDDLGHIDEPDPLQVLTSSLPSTVEGEAYSATLQATGGVAPYTWAVLDGALPAGLVLDRLTGIVAGRASSPGEHVLTVQAEDSAGAKAFRTVTLSVAQAVQPVAILTSGMPDGVRAEPYTHALDASGGLGTYVWALAGGALPQGLTLGAGGVVSGTPVSAGNSTFTVTVADAQDASRQATRTLTLTVLPPPNQLPTVALTPVGSPVPVGGVVALSATASDPDGRVQRVDFWVDGIVVASAPGPAFVARWFVPAPGRYNVKAVAVDDRDGAAESPGMEIHTTSEVVIRAADVFRMVGDFELVADATAADGLALLNPNRDRPKVHVAAAAPESYAEFRFHAEAGRPYQLWIRSRAERNGYWNDSVHVQVAGLPGAAIGTTASLVVNLEDGANAGLSGWGWQDHGYGIGVLGVPLVFPTTGIQTLRIQPREDGLRIDQIVLSPERYLVESPGTLKNDATVLARPAGDVVLQAVVPGYPATADGDIVIRASQASRLVGGYELVADATAAGGEGLRNPDRGQAKASVASASPASYAEFTFYAEAGRPYQVWLRGRAEHDSYWNDSAHLQFGGMDGAAIGTTGSIVVNLEDGANAGLSGWGWQDRGYGAGVLGAPVIFGTTGLQTLRIQPREDGLVIDQVVLSPERYLVTAPGAVKDDATIVAQ